MCTIICTYNGATGIGTRTRVPGWMVSPPRVKGSGFAMRREPAA
jgi:hypothetical protein